jgi:hypothetical protein
MKRKLVALAGLALLTLASFAFTSSATTPTQALCGGGCCGYCQMK